MAGHFYDISLNESLSNNPTLSILSSNGILLEQSHSTNIDVSGTKSLSSPDIGFIAPYTGTYYIATSSQTTTPASFTLAASEISSQTMNSFVEYKLGNISPNLYFKVPSTGNLTLTYCFLQTSPSNDVQSGFIPFNSTEQQALITALNTISAICGINFVQTNDPTNANLRYANSTQTDSEGFEQPVSQNTRDVFFNSTDMDTTGYFNTGSYGLYALIHETGHALGLKHPGDYSGSKSGYPPYAPYGFDNRLFWDMSYLDNPNTGGNSLFASTPMSMDILALQDLYGLPSNIASVTFSVQPNQPYLQALPIGALGSTINGSSLSTNSIITLQAGCYCSMGTISNGVLAHDNLVVPWGSQYTVAIGGSGNDLIISNSLNDTLTGGGGKDTFIVNGTSQITDFSISSDFLTINATGNAIIKISVSGTYDYRQVVQNNGILEIDASGNSDLTISGSNGSNIINGNSGVDTLVMSGPLKNYSISQSGQKITVKDNTGLDGTNSVTNIAYIQFTDQTLSTLNLKTTTYSLASSQSSTYEGNTATFTLTTTNLASGTSVSYTLTGVSSSDIVGGQLSGSVTVGSNGQAIILVPTVFHYQGNETLTVNVNGNTANVVLVQPSATYSLSANGSSVTEGNAATFTLTTTNLASGTSVSYALTGVSSSDIVGGQLSGSVTVGSNGQAIILVPTVFHYQGNETLTVNVNGNTANVVLLQPASQNVILSANSNYIAQANQTISGKSGTNTISISEPYGNFKSSINGQNLVLIDSVGKLGTITLNNIQRVQYTDGTDIATDFLPAQNAFNAVMIIATAFGASKVNTYFGAVISLLDQGQTNSQITTLIENLGLIESQLSIPNDNSSSTDKAWIDFVYKNVFGIAPDPLSEASYVNNLTSGSMSKSQLLNAAVHFADNFGGNIATQINLTGLQTNGITYHASF